MADPKSMPVEQVLLEDGNMSVSLLNYGAITQGWWLGKTPLILGYDNPQDYLSDPFYLGAIVGRVANRIGGAQFALQGRVRHLTANEGPTTLHGGPGGLSRKHWDIVKTAPNQAVLSLTSPDGEGGFPGEVEFKVHVKLTYPCLTYTITARPDRPTPISIAQHTYYSLGCPGDILGCRLRLRSNLVLELDARSVPSGDISAAGENVPNFALSRTVGAEGRELDHYFVFEESGNHDHPVAEVRAPSGLRMNVYSDQPGAQVYTGAHLSGRFSPGAGLCIEPSGYPNAVNIPAFPSVIHTPDNPYRQTLTLEISEGRS
ncbi:aldose epimerase family protein [Ruegeria sp. YS9]|uniref:aldose epimerase family protein n=1 Tax=Ruegeria sp. YS9 TaxID=2966453 RepID=UPI00214A91C6|nr:aldose epimerase family protein [Ruegeria sp. YS9]UUV07125.1 galactose mutarotase [Ruegeria sp. YS9]